MFLHLDLAIIYTVMFSPKNTKESFYLVGYSNTRFSNETVYRTLVIW